MEEGGKYCVVTVSGGVIHVVEFVCAESNITFGKCSDILSDHFQEWSDIHSHLYYCFKFIITQYCTCLRTISSDLINNIK